MYLTEKQTASFTGFSIAKLRADRRNGIGLDFYKIGKSVRYRESDIIKFMERYRINVSTKIIRKKKPLWKDKC